jgi:hypothetical protein
MKRICLIFLILFVAISVKAQQISGTQITSPVVPNDLLDNYPTHIDTLGYGGYRILPDTVSRNNIKPSRRAKGMLVYTLSDSSLYRLKDVNNNKWEKVVGDVNDIDTIPHDLTIMGPLNIIGNPPLYSPELLLNVKNNEEFHRFFVSKNGLLMAGRLHDNPINVDGLYIIGANNYLNGINSSSAGYTVYNNADTSQAYGNFLNVAGYDNSVLIGTGKSEFEPLSLDRANSVQLGANSTSPNIILTEDTTRIYGDVFTYGDINSNSIYSSYINVSDTLKTKYFQISDSTVTSVTAGDTLSTKEYVDLITANYVSLSVGSEQQIPFVNIDGNDFEYSDNLKYDLDKNVFTAGFRIGIIGTNSVVFGGSNGYENVASGYSSAAFGINTTASGYSSAAFGSNTTASRDYSAAFGINTTASGYSSATFGVGSTASGYISAAFGRSTTAHDYLELVLGQYNIIGTGSATSWNETDNLFTIGNGTSTARSNAFQVKKNGNTTISGTLQAKGTMHIAKAEVLYTDTTQTTIITLPAGAVIWDVGIDVDTAFNDSGTDLLDIGITSTANDILNDYDVSTTSFTNQLLSNSPYKVTTSTNITFQFTGQNSDANQGQAYIYIHYSLH